MDRWTTEAHHRPRRRLREFALGLALLAVTSACPPSEYGQAPFDDVRDYSKDLPVFPGAEGFGATTPAGRGGLLIRVTTLAPDGPGSLREALDYAGPRAVIFEVSGIIELDSPLVIREPFATISGQTAPSPGITLSGAGLIVQTHDVLMQHLRIRVGDNPDSQAGDQRDALGLIGAPEGTPEVFNVVVDHCSLSWATDENVSTWYHGVHDVTFRHCIISEGLSHSLHPEGEHSKGMLIGDHSRRIAAIGNLFAHNTERNPLIKGDVSALIANNLIFNPKRFAIHLSDPENSGVSMATIIGNVLVRGKDSNPGMGIINLLLSAKPGTVVYARDNAVRKSGPLSPVAPLGNDDAIPVLLSPLTLQPTNAVTSWVLEHAGARPTDRDSVDARVVKDVSDGMGRIIDSPTDVGGLPPTTPASRTLSPPANPNADDDSDGYTNLEEWLHAFSTPLDPMP
ncbi:MAG: right-handed parallel beta-helix repeat-containing protein [Candidatus Hydrogenedentes bacterium]|nr:right-handed parallel beta-helix repeat-containing protein [Candidatus Hydrogenedentota bacterium]